MIKKFISDFKKYKKYIAYKTKSDLKNEIVGSYLSWLWLIIEPTCFMLIYSFISVIVFRSKIEYFTAFVFIGLTVWNFFSKTLTSSVKLVQSNRDTVTKVYVPKWVLLLSKMCVNTVKFAISFLLVIITMVICRVPISLNVLYFIPIFIVIFLFTFGISSIFMHFGVFVEDLYNITNIGLRMMFYLSGIFYAIDSRIGEPWSTLLSKVNPTGAFITQLRDVLLYKMPMDYMLVLIWGIISIVLCYVGVKTIYKYENTYVKVMR